MALSDRSIRRKQLEIATPLAGNLSLHEGSPWGPSLCGRPSIILPGPQGPGATLRHLQSEQASLSCLCLPGANHKLFVWHLGNSPRGKKWDLLGSTGQ